MDNVLAGIGGTLNNLGLFKLHEVLTGSTYEFDESFKRFINIWTGGTAVTALLLVYLVKRFK